jgi:hypothetical protein
VSAFEFFFTFYGLILGLSVVEVVTGFARLFKGRTRIRVGYVTPMLAMVLLMDLSTYWLLAWVQRDQTVVSYSVLIFGLAVAGAYYFAASLVFPDDFNAASLDEHYDTHKRFVVAMVFAANVLAYVVIPLLSPSGRSSLAELWTTPSYVMAVLLCYAAGAGIILIRNRPLNALLLAGLIGMYISFMFA